MTYYHIITGGGRISGKFYFISSRNDSAKFPFVTSVYGSKTWKTEDGLRRYVAKNHPSWAYETSEQYRERKAQDSREGTR